MSLDGYYSWKEESKKDWRSKKPPESSDKLETHVIAGALMRIADGLEKVIKDYDAVKCDRDRWMAQFEMQRAETKRLARSNAALRGRITALTRKKCK